VVCVVCVWWVVRVTMGVGGGWWVVLGVGCWVFGVVVVVLCCDIVVVVLGGAPKEPLPRNLSSSKSCTRPRAMALDGVV